MGIIKSILIALMILAISAVIVIAIGLIGLPAWVFMLVVFYFLSIEFLNVASLPKIIVGGLVGITLGFGQVLLGMAFSFLGPYAAVATIIVYLLIILFGIRSAVSQSLDIAFNNFTWIFVIVLMMPGATAITNILPSYISFAIGAVVCVIVGYLVKKITSSKARGKASTT